jgi:hypothetical protein
MSMDTFFLLLEQGDFGALMLWQSDEPLAPWSIVQSDECGVYSVV